MRINIKKFLKPSKKKIIAFAIFALLFLLKSYVNLMVNVVVLRFIFPLQHDFNIARNLIANIILIVNPVIVGLTAFALVACFKNISFACKNIRTTFLVAAFIFFAEKMMQIIVAFVNIIISPITSVLPVEMYSKPFMVPLILISQALNFIFIMYVFICVVNFLLIDRFENKDSAIDGKTELL